MRLPNSAHESQPWLIHDIARDFQVEDVWAVPATGDADEFPRLVQLVASLDPSQSPLRVMRALFAVRWKLGQLLGWDGPDSGVGARVPTLRDRLASDLRSRPGPEFAALPFRSLYLVENEFAAEIANRTMHGVVHLGWVGDEGGAYRGQLAVLVKPNGRLGSAYLAAIKPFRYVLVYPAMLRRLGRLWETGQPAPPAAAAQRDRE